MAFFYSCGPAGFVAGTFICTVCKYLYAGKKPVYYEQMFHDNDSRFWLYFRVYFWTDDHGRKLKCSAPLYFDYAMSYIQELLTDEDVFPTKAGQKHLIYVTLFYITPRLEGSAAVSSLLCRFGVSHRIRLPRPESVFAVFQDSGSHLLVSL